MPHQTVTATAFARNFSDYLNQVRYQGITLDVRRGNEIVACVSPPETRPGYPMDELDQLIAKLPRLTAEDAAAFQRDIDEVAQQLTPPANAWDA
jgi:hypothetical protein